MHAKPKLNSVQGEPNDISKFEFPFQLKQEEITIDENYDKQKFSEKLI